VTVPIQLLNIWLVIYVLALGAVGWGLRPWYRRRWFKLLFLPGTLLGALLQALAALLCVHPIKKVHGFKDGQPFVELGLPRIPTLGAALFVVVTQTALFVLFLLSTLELEAAGLFKGNGLALPTLGNEASAATLGAAANTYFSATLGWLGQAKQQPLVTLLLLYIFGSTFGALRLCRRQWQSALLGLVALWAITFVGGWFGVGVRTFSRGWWAAWLYVPEWWERFSVFLTLGFVALGGITTIRGTRAVGRRLATSLRSPQSLSRRLTAR
jgi:hypothetical protein